MRRRITTTFVLAALLVASTRAQTPQSPTPTPESPTQTPQSPTQTPQTPLQPSTIEDVNPLTSGASFSGLSELSDDYQVGPGDLLEVQVVGHDDMTESVRISNSGEISLSMLGLIRVADLTGFEVESLIASGLREKQLIKEPDVLVFVREYQSKPVYVSGAVVNPGEFVMSRELTAADAVLLAGGLRYNAGDEAFLHRRATSAGPEAPATAAASKPGALSPDDQVITIDMKPLKEGRFFEVSTLMKKGDVLIIPQRMMNTFFVVGDVIDPHNFLYPPGAALTVSQAISWAQGPTPTAKMSDGMLVRYDTQGNRQEMKVDYAAILSGRQPDFLIQPNDVIFIPGSTVKTIAHGLVQATGLMIMQQSFRYGRQVEYSNRADEAAAQFEGR